jgi:hypothetical protein
MNATYLNNVKTEYLNNVKTDLKAPGGSCFNAAVPDDCAANADPLTDGLSATSSKLI